MIILLPYQNYNDISYCLDKKRLLTQCKNGVTILKAIKKIRLGEPSDLANHQTLKMWLNYGRALSDFTYKMTRTLMDYNHRYVYIANELDAVSLELSRLGNWDFIEPWWNEVDYDTIRESHRAFLIRNNPSYYARKWLTTDRNLPLIWP